MDLHDGVMIDTCAHCGKERPLEAVCGIGARVAWLCPKCATARRAETLLHRLERRVERAVRRAAL